jgi:dTDP-4-amino-4,6-dideoxygalactose transaminase
MINDKVAESSKQTIDELALFGGEPVFREQMHVGRPNIGDRRSIISRINEILDRRYLTNNGPYVQEFERRIAEMVGVKHCIAMCNGTVALEIAIRALNLKGEVIVPAFTFIATAHALQWQEITPVFCDIDPDTHTIDPDKVVTMITPRTTGIIGVHLWGHPCNIDALTGIAARYNLDLLFDAAHAFGCSYNGRMIGGFGQAEVFSFHATKILNTFEGGAVVTNNDELASKIRLMKNFGFCGYDNVIYIGTNGKMDEVSAAMGLTGIESLEQFIHINYSNYKTYQSELTDVPGITVNTYNEKEKCNYQYIALDIDEEIAGIGRDELIQILHAENILARRYFFPGCHRMEPYRSYFPHAGMLLPETERIAGRLLLLPTGTSISVEEVNNICQIVRFAVEHGNEIRVRMEKKNEGVCKAEEGASHNGSNERHRQ